MTGNPIVDFVLLPLGFGLLGFVEPCSIGSTLIFIKVMEGRSAGLKLREVGVFALTRAVFVGLLGLAAAVAGTQFLTFQRGAWVVLGAFYAALGGLYSVGRAGSLMWSFGPRATRLSGARGAASLGLLFGFNIPACAAPLLLALLAAAAGGGATGGTLAMGFASLALFGFALSLPLVIAVLFDPARRALDWLAGLSRRLPFWTGLLLMALGVWSVWFGLFARLPGQ